MSIATRVALGAAGLVALATTIHYIAGIAFQGRISTSGAEAAEIDAFNGLSMQLSLLSIAVSLGSGIVFLRWLWRSVLNAPVLGAERGIVDPRGAVTAWLIPIRNFWKPYRVVVDLHDRLLAPLQSRSGRWLIRIWWVSWLLGTVVGEIILYSRPSTFTGGSDRVYFMALLGIASAVSVAGAVLAITVVAQLERLAHARECACLGDPNRAIALVNASQRRRITTLPFGVALVALIALLVPIGVVTVDASKPAAWTAFTSPDGSFSIDMPTTPTPQSQSSTGVEIRSYRAGINAQIIFIAGYAEYPAGTVSRMDQSTVFYTFERGLDSSVSLTSRDISIDGNAGREWSGSTLSFDVKMRVYLVGDRAYILEVDYERSMAGSPDIDRFLDSFRLD